MNRAKDETVRGDKVTEPESLEKKNHCGPKIETMRKIHKEKGKADAEHPQVQGEIENQKAQNRVRC